MRDAVLAPSRATRRARLRGLIADACHVLLTTSLWLGSTMLVALGILFAFAIVPAGGEPAIFFAHLDNLANHYLAASPDRRAEFDAQLLALLGRESKAVALILVHGFGQVLLAGAGQALGFLGFGVVLHRLVELLVQLQLVAILADDGNAFLGVERRHFQKLLGRSARLICPRQTAVRSF